MIGHENDFVSFLKKYAPKLIIMHCVSHLESLATTNASKNYSSCYMLKKLQTKCICGFKTHQREVMSLMIFLKLRELIFLMSYIYTQWDSYLGRSYYKAC